MKKYVVKNQTPYMTTTLSYFDTKTEAVDYLRGVRKRYVNDMPAGKKRSNVRLDGKTGILRVTEVNCNGDNGDDITLRVWLN